MTKFMILKDIVINPTESKQTTSKPKQYIPPKEDILILELMAELNKQREEETPKITNEGSSTSWEYAALIVETRKNNYLFDIIKHTLACLPPNFGLYIIGSSFNQDWLKEEVEAHTEVVYQSTELKSGAWTKSGISESKDIMSLCYHLNFGK